MKLIELNISKILELCHKYKVKSLAVFGSILTDRFTDASDVDMLVVFNDYDPDNPGDFDYVDNYFGLKYALENIFSREVDLIEYGDNLNPLFKESVDKHKIMIYG